MIRPARRLLWLLVVLAAVGCAAGTSGSETERRPTPPRVRCLSEPERDTREGTRPLFFFFCIESP